MRIHSVDTSDNIQTQHIPCYPEKQVSSKISVMLPYRFLLTHIRKPVVFCRELFVALSFTF